MAKLNAAARNALPDSDFAVVKVVDGKKVRKFPINDPAHARDALARVANRSPQLKAKVDHKITAKQPALAKRSEAIKGRQKANSPHNPV